MARAGRETGETVPRQTLDEARSLTAAGRQSCRASSLANGLLRVGVGHAPTTRPIESDLVKPLLVIWSLMLGLLLQSAAWALPGQGSRPVERLAHEVAHALDHGHHAHHDEAGLAASIDGDWDADHGQDPALQLDESQDANSATGFHGPHHQHASDGGQFQGLPLSATPLAAFLPHSAPRPWAEVQPPSADLVSWLRPPRATA